jgi:large subunit ribosomal protein L21
MGSTLNKISMYAIVDVAGKQYRVEEGQKVYVHRLEGVEGSEVTFEKVLMIDADGKVVVGQPVVEGASVSATILSHLKGDKVLVFKKKRRKGYQKLNGHRQYLSQIKIDKISEKAAKKKAAKKAEPQEDVIEVAEHSAE